MEGNFGSEAPPSPADIGLSDALNRSNSDASALTAEYREDILHRSANVKPSDHTIWTEEKHSLYLENLEASFVKQLHQSMWLLAQRSDRNKRDENISQVRPTNFHNASQELTVGRSGRGTNINCKRGYYPSNVSAGSTEVCMLRGTENHGKVIKSHGLGSCSQNISSSSSTREGTGQNFVNEGSHDKFTGESRVKRLKISLVD